MIQTPFTRPFRYITCPACLKTEHEVSHLPAGTQTSWYCDGCGVRFSVHVLDADQVECTVIPGEYKEKIAVRLRSTRPVTIIVEGVRLHPETDSDDFIEHQRYFYEEHTCPTNFLGVEEVLDDAGDKDPHGIFSLISAEPWPKSS